VLPSKKEADSTKAEKAIKALGGNVVRSFDEPGRPIIRVEFRDTQLSDAVLKELAGLVSLQELDLYATNITDAGLKELAGLKGLQCLTLPYRALDVFH
jgi:hypothetical protein